MGAGVTDDPNGRRPGWFTAALSSTPIAREYLASEAATRPAEPLVTTFDAKAYAPELVAEVRAFWLDMMQTEYESAYVFVDMAAALRDIDETLDFQAVALRMAGDELRHTAIAARVIELMGGEPRIGPRPHLRARPHADCGPEENALRAVIYGCCLSETVNAARLVERYADTTDPLVRDAYRLLLADERLHATFGFHYLESRRAWLEAHEDVRRSLERYLRYAFGALEQAIGAVPTDARPLTAAQRALGLPDLLALSRTFQEPIANATVPGLERFGLAAAAAWRDRLRP